MRRGRERGESRGAALRQMAGEVYQLLHGGCQFKFTTRNETHRGRTSKGMPTEFSSYWKPEPEPAESQDAVALNSFVHVRHKGFSRKRNKSFPIPEMVHILKNDSIKYVISFCKCGQNRIRFS